jgi:multiple sugar transport system ATP-binding protein
VLNEGVIQQLGTPQELYDRPANLFVAGFIGSPAMDMLYGTIRRAADGVELTLAGRTVTLTGQSAAAAAHAASGGERAVVAGVRPEDFHLSSEGADNSIVGVVDVVEHLGNEQLIYVQSAAAHAVEGTEVKSLTARVEPGVSVRPGDSVTIALDPARVHLFDAESGKRL